MAGGDGSTRSGTDGGGSGGRPGAGGGPREAGPAPEEAGAPARVPVIDPADAPEELAAVYDAAGIRGRVAHIIGAHSLHPDAMSAHLQLYRTLMFGASPLSRAERESIAVVVSSVNDCFY